MATCKVCFRHCEIPEGKHGICGARICREGKVVPENYGRITSLALDPIEKKPLHRFFPGSRIISVGSYGCNLRCPFCQNNEISWGDEVSLFQRGEGIRRMEPEDLLSVALAYRDQGNIGLAFTYNEPLVGYEFIRDTAKLIHDAGMKNVLVSNGTASLEVLSEILPFIDAMNIDLKSFSEETYHSTLGGDLPMVKEFISEAVKSCHVELTTLIVPGLNDSKEEMREIASWIAERKDKEGNTIGETIPLHVSRFFPRFHMQDREATKVKTVYELADTAREKLRFVYTGNC